MAADFNRQTLLDLAAEVTEHDKPVNILTLSDELTISQVVRFFERQDRTLTKTMIQNYVRVGVLPPPKDKRNYTRDHLVMLALIDELKSIYSLDEINHVLAPIRNDPSIFEDDMVSSKDVYDDFHEFRRAHLERWDKQLPELFEKVGKMLEADGVNPDDRSKALPSMVALSIMAETVALRQLINRLLKLDSAVDTEPEA